VRPFGKTDLAVSEFGVGCARIGGVFQRDPRGFLNLFSAAYDAGINLFDTADMYAQGESEVLLGRAFRNRRSRVIIASKVGYRLPGRRRLAGRLKPLLRPLIRLLGLRRDRLPASARGALAQDFSPAYVKEAVEGSLRRLKTDYLDVLQLHSPPVHVVERGEWEAPLEALKRAGKIRYYGIAVDSVEAGLAALRFGGVSSVQFTLNLLERRALDALLPRASAAGVAFIARECLANGLLAKPLGQVDVAAYCSSPEERAVREQQLAEAWRRATEAGTSLSALALQYVQAVPGVSVALLGVRNVEQLTGLLAQAPLR